MFTAAATLQLVDEGRIKLEDRVRELLPTANLSISAQITVAHLLTMTSGIADWFDESVDWQETWAALVREHPISLIRETRDYLPLFATKPALFAPGERHQYNGAGYLLLGLLIEQVTGEPFVEYVERAVLRPAGAGRSGYIALDDVVAGVADGYIPIREEDQIVGWRRNIYSTTPRGAADGGATSTAADLIAFTRALRTGRLLSESSTTAMLTPQVSERAEKVRGYSWMYGYGVMFILDGHGETVRWGHTGEDDGVSCRLYHYPATDTDVVILSNTSWSAGPLAWNIHDLLMRS
jgi:CubicO group peptidase (beta-lactamase class C family)